MPLTASDFYTPAAVEANKPPDETQSDEYGGLSGAALTGTLGALSGASLGLSDWAIPKAVGLLGNSDDAALAGQQIKKLREANPISNYAGQIGGFLGSTILTGGATAAGEAGVLGAGKAVAALTPAGLLARGGAAVERGALSLLPETAGAFTKAAVGLGARGAAETAVMNFGDAIGESAIDNQPLTAEKTAMALLEGGVLGGVMGSGLGVTGAAAGWGLRKAAGAIGKLDLLDSFAKFANKVSPGAADAYDSAIKGVEGKMPAKEVAEYLAHPKTTVTGLAEDLGKGISDLDKLEPEAMAYKATSREAIKEANLATNPIQEIIGEHLAPMQADHVLNNQAREMTEAVNTANEAISKADEAAFGSAKRENYEKFLTDTGSLPEAKINASEVINTVKAQMKHVIESPHLQDMSPKKFDDLTNDLIAAVNRAEAPHEIASALDLYKRHIGKLAEFGKFDKAPSAEYFAKAYDTLKTNLESPEIWGERFASAQSEINGAKTRLIDSQKAFKSAFMQNGEAGGGKITGALKKIDSTSKDQAFEALANQKTAALDYMAAVEKHVGPQEAYNTAKKAYGKIDSVIADVRKGSPTFRDKVAAGLEDALQSRSAALTSAARKGDAKGVYDALNETHELLSKSAAEQRSKLASMGAVDQEITGRTANRLEQARDKVASYLDNPEVFGESASKGKVVRDALTDYQNTLADVKGEFHTDGRVDPSKTASNVMSLTDPATHQPTQKLEAFQQAADRLSQAIGKPIDVSGMAGALDKTRTIMPLMQQVLNHEQSAWSKAAPWTAAMAGGALGGFKGYAALAAAGRGIAAAGKAQSAIQAIATMHKISEKIDTHFGKSIERFFAGKKSGLPGSGSLITRANYFDHVDALKEAPNDLAGKIGHAVGDLGTQLPNITGGIGITLAKAVTFLDGKLPKPATPNNLIGTIVQRPPSDIALREYSKSVEGALHPQKTIENLADGSVSRQQVEALRVVYPAVFAELQQKLIMESEKLNKNLDPNQITKLSLFFDVPLRATLAPNYVNYFQGLQGQAAEAKKPKPARSNTNLSGISAAMSTPLQKMKL